MKIASKDTSYQNAGHLRRSDKGVLIVRSLLLALALAVGVAHSQERTANDIPPSKPNTQKAAKKGAADNRGTEKQPLVVKALKAEKTSEQIEQERSENEQKAHREERLVFWTLTLAVVTGFLCLIAGGQLWMFWRQLRYMSAAVADGAKMAKAALDTAETTRAQFMATHRPRLIVRWVYLIDEKTVQYEVTNVGELGAEIVAIHAEICLDKLPAYGPYTAKPGMTVPLIHAGESRPIPCVVMEDKAVTEFQMEIGWNTAIAEGQHPSDARKIYFLGYISYKDKSIGIGHRTSFCRLYDYRKRRFMPITDPDADYEHTD